MSRQHISCYGSTLIIGACVWVIVTLRLRWGGYEELQKHAVYDTSAHLLTALVIAVALRSARIRVPIWAILIGGVLPDVGQFTTILGITHAIDGSSRNGTHSLLAVLVVASIALADRPHARVWIGIAAGMITHLLRDLGTGTVPLGWPFSLHVWSIAFSAYIAILVGAALAILAIGQLERSRHYHD